MYEPHRLHPAAILVFIGRNLRQMWQVLLPWFAIIVSKWSSFKGWGTFLLALTIVIYILYTTLYWMRYHYSIQGQELLLESGLFIRKKISIPLERIHGVQISQGLVQRLFGLVKLEVETAGGGKKAEVSLDIEMKDEVFRDAYYNKIWSLEDMLKDYIGDFHKEEFYTLENGKVISRIWVEKLGVGFSNKNTWDTIFDFFNENMHALEMFYLEYDEFIKDIDSL